MLTSQLLQGCIVHESRQANFQLTTAKVCQRCLDWKIASPDAQSDKTAS